MSLRKISIISSLFFLFQFQSFGQKNYDYNTVESGIEPNIIIPNKADWNLMPEGEESKIKFGLSHIDTNYHFAIRQGKQLGMEIDSSGLLTWTPAYTLVDRIEQRKLFQLIIEAKSENNSISKYVDLIVEHRNRAPIVNELKPFYIQYNNKNKYQIDNNLVFDEDFDPLVFIPSIEELPEGMTITSRGEISWSPSFTQFKALKENPFFIEFTVEDQPSKSKTNGRLKLIATQLDLPPTLTVVPNVDKIILKENETVNLGFYLSDPNGDEDLETFDFLSNNKGIHKQDLTQNTPTQYEFIWTPGYDFVKDPLDSVGFYIDFFVLDKTQKREVKRIHFRVENTVNEEEVDRKNYELYKGTLTRAWELVEQLKEKEDELKKTYNKAKKGKKSRSVVNASLGATTGLSSIFTKDKPDTQRLISTVGGTTVLTIGTLEATEVIGKSMKDIVDRLNYVIEKKNEIQTKGDIFARDFSLRSSRRENDFVKKMNELLTSMNLKGLVAFELDASWENKKEANSKNLTKTFKDYNPLDI